MGRRQRTLRTTCPSRASHSSPSTIPAPTPSCATPASGALPWPSRGGQPPTWFTTRSSASCSRASSGTTSSARTWTTRGERVSQCAANEENHAEARGAGPGSSYSDNSAIRPYPSPVKFLREIISTPVCGDYEREMNPEKVSNRLEQSIFRGRRSGDRGRWSQRKVSESRDCHCSGRHGNHGQHRRLTRFAAHQNNNAYRNHNQNHYDWRNGHHPCPTWAVRSRGEVHWLGLFPQ